MGPLLVLLAVVAAQDPVQVRARLQDEAIRAGQNTVLRVDVETAGERARIEPIPSLPPGLEVLSTRNFDQRQFGIPGGARRFVSREYVLRARAVGRYRIPAVDVTVGGRTYSTRSQLLTVTAAPSGLRRPEGAQEDGVILRVWVDADTVVVGEQVTLEAEALFSPDARLRLRRAPEYEAPSPEGFWIHDLPERRRATTRFVGQEQYEVQRFSRVIFPLAPGEYEIPPARLEYETRRGLLYAPETHELRSEPLRLVVLPVPADRPPAYTGAVGRYEVRGRVEPGAVPAGEAVVLTIEVEGEGNVKALPPPDLPELESVEVFPPGEESETEIREGFVRGTKRFSWVLIPRQPGDVTIPEIPYPYYDPGTGTFESAAVPSMRLDVSAGPATADRAPPPQLRYLDPDPEVGDPLAWVRSWWFAALQLLPLLGLASAMAWRRRGGRSGSSLRQLRRERRTRFRELSERVGSDGTGVLDETEAFVRGWVARRLGIGRAEVGRPEALTVAGVERGTAYELRAMLDRLASARYAPDTPDVAEQRAWIERLKRLVESIDRQAPRVPAGATASSAGVAGAVGLFLLCATGLSAQTLDRPEAEFRAGVRAYDQERYVGAVGAFGQYVDRRPRDPAGWYNLGTAYHRAGLPGYAVWAWLKVPRLDPRHADVRHNLRVAGVSPGLVRRVAPPLPLHATELWLLASVAWFLGAAAAAIRILRRRRWTGTAAATLLLVAAGLAGAGWASTREASTLIVLHGETLRAGPNLGADPVVELEAGAGVAPVEVRSDWARVRTLTGTEGWIETTATAHP